MREIILDTETTGLSFEQGDRIIEVGCVELHNHVPTGKTLQFFCNVQKKISEEASKIHGITNEFLNPHPTFKENAKNLINFVKEDTIVIHNASFDMGFINNELKIIGLPELKNKIIDTVSLARKKLNTRIANLDYLCRRFNIDLSARKLHGALLDSHLLAEVYLELNGGKQISMDLYNSDKKNKQKGIIETKRSHKFIKIQPNEEELLQHRLNLKQIKNPLWEKFTTKNN